MVSQLFEFVAQCTIHAASFQPLLIHVLRGLVKSSTLDKLSGAILGSAISVLQPVDAGG